MTSPLIYTQLAKVMGAVGAVTKGRRNQSQGYQFRGIDDVQAHVQGVLAEHGVICVPRVIERERELMPTKSGGSMASVRLLVEHTFYAADGSSVICTTLGEAMDSGDKASNKAMSAALKYALTETLMIPTYEVDRDTEDASPEVVTPDVMERGQPPVSTKRADADVRGHVVREGGRVSTGDIKQGEATKARGPEFDQFMEASQWLQQVWKGEEGATDRLKWWMDRAFKRDEVPPKDWNPGKWFMAKDAKAREKLVVTAKALADSEKPPEDR